MACRVSHPFQHRGTLYRPASPHGCQVAWGGVRPSSCTHGCAPGARLAGTRSPACMLGVCPLPPAAPDLRRLRHCDQGDPLPQPEVGQAQGLCVCVLQRHRGRGKCHSRWLYLTPPPHTHTHARTHTHSPTHPSFQTPARVARALCAVCPCAATRCGAPCVRVYWCCSAMRFAVGE
jgi:hypothetical protein